MAQERPTDPDKPALVLFRDDLRVGDNRALAAAAGAGKPVVCAFLFDETAATRPRGAARRWWLHHSLEALTKRLEALGGELILRSGPQGPAVDGLISETGADTVFWNRRYDPPASAADARMKTSLRSRGLQAESFDGHLLHEPSLLKTTTNGPYKVYTPFWRALSSGPEPRDPVAAPKELRPLAKKLASEKPASWQLLPSKPDWSGGMAETWTPGEDGAHQRIEAFLDGALDGYGAARDLPGTEGTSRLSPHLVHGEITPYQILAALRRRRGGDAVTFRKELGWREFCHHLLFHNPDLHRKNYNPTFDAFPWRGDKRALAAWQTGETGYPVVDAGMRQLWQTGWMHNRVRMIVASFLIKHLLIDWREGESWFWDTLVDADPASNPGNWQWVAGSGADASPYFRVFNPILQGEKFDTEGDYVRAHVPELGKMPKRFVHRPWDAPAGELDKAGVKLGRDYPVALVAHEEARQRALDAYRSIRGGT